MGASIIVLGAQGEPGFPKFSCTDPDGWPSTLTIPAAITKTAARAINFLFLISMSSKCLTVRFFLTNRKLTRSPKSSPPY